MIITLRNCLVPDCEGADHKWEWSGRPTLREIKRIEQATGMDIETWNEGLNELGRGMTSKVIDACLALVDILHRRDGIKVAFDDIDVDLADLDFDLDEAEADEEDQTDEAGKDPAQTSPSQNPEAEDDAPEFGGSTKAASKPKSSRTARTSGGSSGSP